MRRRRFTGSSSSESSATFLFSSRGELWFGGAFSRGFEWSTAVTSSSSLEESTSMTRGSCTAGRGCFAGDSSRSVEDGGICGLERAAIGSLRGCGTAVLKEVSTDEDGFTAGIPEEGTMRDGTSLDCDDIS